jgi:hypothetical protein
MKRSKSLLISGGIIAMAMTFFTTPSRAQSFDGEFGFFDHVGAGVSLGTDGIGIDVAAPLTDWGAVRAGISFMPAIKYTKKDVEIDDPAVYPKVDIDGKLNIFDFKILADFYPFQTSSFHVTAGAFIGSSTAVKAENAGPFFKDKDTGIRVGDYAITCDDNGDVHADVKVNSFKPYIGIGFGRAIPKKNRVSVSFDFGVKFWGTPGVGVETTKPWGTFGRDNLSYHKFTYDEVKTPRTGEADYMKDVRDALEIANKIIVYPVLNVRLTGRIF